MNNGNGKWQVGFWVITFLVVGAFTWSTICYLNNERRIFQNTERLYNLKEVANDCLHKIDLRLSRIEDKLDIK